MLAEPKTFDSERTLAFAARRLGQRAAALEHFRTADAIRPGVPWNLADVATELRELGRLDEAEEVARAIIEKSPESPMGWRALGELMRQRGQRAEALQHFQAVSVRAPDDLWARAGIAVELRALGRLDEAEEVAHAITEKNPESLIGWRALGELMRQRGRRAEALQHFQAASARAPDDVWGQADVAGELRELGRFDEAEQVARAIIAKNPGSSMGWRALGAVARSRGDRRQALEFLYSAVALEPDNLWLKVEITVEFRELKQFEEAEAYAQRLTERQPGSAIAWTTLANCSRHTRPAGEVLALFEQAVEREPASLFAREALGNEYAARWRLDDAERQYDEMLATDRRNLAALIGKAQVARRRGDHEKSLEILATTARSEPDSERVSIEYARDLVEAGRHEDAELMLGALIERNPNQPWTLLFLGHTARALGDGEKARRFFEAAVAFSATSDQARVEVAVEEYRAGRSGDARLRLEEILARRPDFVHAIEAMSHVAQGSHDIETAYEMRRAALVLDGSQLGRRMGLAWLEAAMGQTEAANRIASDCEAWFGALPEISLARAHFQRIAGDHAREFELLTEARIAFPTHFDIWFHLTKAMIAGGRFEDALRAVEAPPNCTVRERSRVQFLRGEIAAAQWRLEEANAHYASALANSPAESWFHFGVARNALARVDMEVVEKSLIAMTRADPAHRARHNGGCKPMQTHVGQILDEYRVDGDSLARLRAANASRYPIAALQALVRERPDYTPAAIGLLIQLRRKGLFDRPAPRHATELMIPRKISQYWDERIPPDIERLCEEWRTKNPNFVYRRFSNAEARRFLDEHGPPGARRAFDFAVEPAMKADLFRLALLVHEGGFYADADDRCLKALDEVAAPGCELLIYQEDFGTAANNFIGAIPQHPVLALALADAIEAINRGDRDLLWLATGPGLITRSLARHLAEGKGALERIRVLDRHELHLAIAVHCAASYKHSGQHWLQTTFGKTRGTPKRNGETSVAQIN
ncbi:MAG: tetratricopeptide repeat protein [Pseudomonadota bacterium]|nr:tetratricopeptide repeat protein [Pseudomonadota bacterium]